MSEETPKETRRSFGWRTLLVAATVAVIASLALPTLLLGGAAFGLAMAVPFAIGLVVFWRWPRIGAGVLGVVAIAILAVSAPFAIEPFSHPEAATDFVPFVVLVVGALLIAVAAWPARREVRTPGGSGKPRTLAIASIGLIVAAGVVSAIASVGVNDVAAQPGDIEMTAADYLFQPATAEASATSVAIHLTNSDATRHTFTIDELGIDVSIAPNSTARVTFDADAGVYRFYCTLHVPSMEGALFVSSG